MNDTSSRLRFNLRSRAVATPALTGMRRLDEILQLEQSGLPRPSNKAGRNGRTQSGHQQVTN